MSADTALVAAINRLRQDRNAVILAHYYQEPEIQDIADFVGDSLELSRKAASTDADVIVFCGVHFMAETAKILSPEKTVVLPDLEAGCSLADDCPADEFARFRAEHPDHFVVSYINCTAAVKAQSDLICTSSNGLCRGSILTNGLAPKAYSSASLLSCRHFRKYQTDQKTLNPLLILLNHQPLLNKTHD